MLARAPINQSLVYTRLYSSARIFLKKSQTPV